MPPHMQVALPQPWAFSPPDTSLYSVPGSSLPSSLTCKNFLAFVLWNVSGCLPLSHLLILNLLIFQDLISYLCLPWWLQARPHPLRSSCKPAPCPTLGIEMCSQPPGLALMWTTALSCLAEAGAVPHCWVGAKLSPWCECSEGKTVLSHFILMSDMLPGAQPTLTQCRNWVACGPGGVWGFADSWFQTPSASSRL